MRFPSLLPTLLTAVAGAIFGTGTNGAYLEKVDNITKLGDSPARQQGGHMVVNCEWGAFNNTVRRSAALSSFRVAVNISFGGELRFPQHHLTIS